MEFGKVAVSELDKINFQLPPDHPATTALLANQKSTVPTELFIGCAKWGKKEWVGNLYPPKTKEADYLIHYAKHFNCIELNTTFYRMPTPQQVRTWKSKVGDGFRFCPKFTDQITHFRRLANVKELTDQFLQSISEFESNLGPIFLMPHPQMGPRSMDIIQSFMESLPTDIELFLELRHPEWYAPSASSEKMFAFLHHLKRGCVLTDASGRRDCLHMRLTTPEAFIRFVGNDLHPSDYLRIDDWVQRIKSWKEQGIHKIWFFMHQHDELNTLKMCRYLIAACNQHCHTHLHVPPAIQAQASLFEATHSA